MGRLTDGELDEALAVAQSLNSLRLTAAVAELKERRAQDLTNSERNWIEHIIELGLSARSDRFGSLPPTAEAAVTKLLTRGNR